MNDYIKLKKPFLIFAFLLTATIIYQFPLVLDLTANKMNSLSEADCTLLSTLNKPLTIDLYSREQHIITQVKTILSLFQKESAHIVFNVKEELLNTPDKKRLRLQTYNNMLFTYGDRKKAIDIYPEKWNTQAFSNLIQHLSRTGEDWVVFLSGHGEADLLNNTNQDLSQLTSELKTAGMNIASLNLNEMARIPDNTKMLVIIDPKTDFLPKETNQILHYLEQGGNLLWLVNPSTKPHLATLAKYLGIIWPEGTILDQKSHAIGVPHPAISILTKYPEHMITESLNMVTVFPWARSLQYEKAPTLGWQVSPLFVSNAVAMLEVNPSKKSQQVLNGPFTIGITLEKHNQRIAVIGNTHFLSNGSIHNYGNLQLANNIFNWLMDADLLLNTSTKPTKPLIDLSFTQSAFTKITLQFVFPFCLPLIYLLMGWQTKRKRQNC